MAIIKITEVLEHDRSFDKLDGDVQTERRELLVLGVTAHVFISYSENFPPEISKNLSKKLVSLLLERFHVFEYAYRLEKSAPQVAKPW